LSAAPTTACYAPRMAWRWLLVACGLVLWLVVERPASANGRPPGTATITFRRGQERDIAAGLTFGLVLSRDGGATWGWMCEDAIGYAGTYDPTYAFTSSGTLFATTLTGLKVMRDGCTFAPAVSTKFVSVVAQGGDGKLYYTAVDTPAVGNPGDSNIYRSDDDGETWPVSAMPGMLNDWWQSLEVAPSNASRLYLSGYRFVPSGGGGTLKVLLLFRSDNAGQTWQALPTSQFVTMSNSVIEIAGISHTAPDLVFARVKLEDNVSSNALYRSTDAGMTWTRILGKGSAISFLARQSGEIVAATQALGAARSIDNGTTWAQLASPPHIGCLAENGAGEVWACTQNYGGVQIPSDGFGIMKSTDLVTWTGVLKYEQIAAPVTCAAGTVQRDTCDVQLWCGLCNQIGCTLNRPECGVIVDAPTGGRDADSTPRPGPSDQGCCRVSATTVPVAPLFALVVVAVLLRARRSR
jgi:hypothetical protein